MAVNAVNTSLRDLLQTKTKRDEVIEEIFMDNKIAYNFDSKYPQRNIVVLGAGASYNACKKLYLGGKAAKRIKDRFKNISKEIEIELDRLEKIYKLDKNEFETILLAISKFDSKKLIEEIFKIYNHRFNPNLTYEILAHMLKHRFIDAIINFNFDELLDQSIEDELMNSEYYKVISDGDIQNNFKNILFEDSLRLPIYIKPHGTTGHKSSMKFTDSDYYGLSRDIENLLEILISGNTKSDLKSKHKIKVNLIIIGFNMKSFEFNSIINKCLPVNIYFFNPDIPKIDERVKNNFLNDINHVIVDNNENQLDKIVFRLWESIEKEYNDHYKPRDIKRHQFISEIFGDKNKLKSGNDIEEYLKDRMYIELVFSIAKYKGFLSIAQLANDRFGNYYDIYEYYSKALKSKISLIELCEKFCFKDNGYARKALKLSLIKGKNLTFKVNFFDGKYFDELIKTLTKRNGLLSNNLKIRFKDKCLLERFRNTLKTLAGTEDAEICPKYEKIYNNMFANPQIIKTGLGIDYFTRFYMKEKFWNTLFIVAESGEWLLNKIDDKCFTNKCVMLIIADPAFKEELDEKFKCCIYKRIYTMKWWQHNQHMTIFANFKPKKIKIQKSIYLEKRLRYSQINPVILSNEKDNEILLETFSAYHLKADKNLKFLKRETVLKNKERILKSISSKLYPNTHK